MSCINEICNRANRIKDLNDISDIPGLRTFFSENFFNILKDILCL